MQVGGLADYVADNFSIRELLDIVDWRPKAEARIDRLRKADFSVRYVTEGFLINECTNAIMPRGPDKEEPRKLTFYE